MSSIDILIEENTVVRLTEPVDVKVSIIWILIIVVVALAPLISALPSEAQRYEARVRDHAIKKGVSIKLDPPPIIPPRFRLEPDLELVAYRRRREQHDVDFKMPKIAVKSLGQWLSVPMEMPVKDVLLRLPEGAHIVELAEHYVCVFWDEKGGEDAVDKIVETLDLLLRETGFE